MTTKNKLLKKKAWIKPTINMEKIKINLFFSSKRSRMNEMDGILLSAISCSTCDGGYGCILC